MSYLKVFLFNFTLFIQVILSKGKRNESKESTPVLLLFISRKVENIDEHSDQITLQLVDHEEDGKKAYKQTNYQTIC